MSSMLPWIPELEVTEELARTLIKRQFSELGSYNVKPIDSGWDNVVYSLNEKLFFRFPQRQMAVEPVEREIQCLPIIYNQIPHVPRLTHAGVASSLYPWPFFGYEPVSGKESCELSLTLSQRTEIASKMAEWLSLLHSQQMFKELKSLLPVDPLGRLDFSIRIPQTESRLLDLKASGVDLPYEELARILKMGGSLRRVPPTAVVHGDLHFRHLIVDSKSQLSGLIDWGDLHLNDPAVDLQVYWSFIPSQGRPFFQKKYGPISEDQLIVARAFAVFVNIALLQYAMKTQKDYVKREALFALSNLLTN